ncbi:MAG: hypothetical protein E2O52_03065 [Gammaproteobacteria bacterium]|nr:MAG: hypothetical protein E2O52_03065 [Gammaproteobacteria bacterium]
MPMNVVTSLNDVDPAWIVGGVALLVLLAGLIRAWLRRNRSLEQRLGQVSADTLSGILIPDGDDGEIHIEHALLTHRGVLVIDIKRVEGNVFGSDSMHDWTVISDTHRFTFSNPQPALYDRMAAIRRLMPNVPVTGYIAFTNRAEFSKGQPSNVVMLDELLDALRAEQKTAQVKSVDAFYPHWSKLRDEAVTAQVGQLLKRQL